jgi:hypothetical protein
MNSASCGCCDADAEPGSGGVPVGRFDFPPIAVPPGGLLVPGGSTNNCGSITAACAAPAPAKTTSTGKGRTGEYS